MTATKTGDGLARFLSRGESYGLPGVTVTRIETHCSEVFLVGNRAYKLKRPVTFSSLDYHSVALREAACRAELVRNRRTAPELYLGLHAVRRRTDGTLSFDGKGRIVDWLVAMRRFDQADLFDRLAEAGQLTPTMMRDLADETARFHADADVTFRFGGAAGIRDAAERNHHDLATVTAVLDEAKINGLHTATLDAIAPLASLLDDRRDRGKVRRVHGDLRLANICLIEGRPTLFDAVEFSDGPCCIDVLFDLAFLLADLHHRELRLLANIVFNRYLDAAPNVAGLAVLPLMLSLRMAMRAYGLAGKAQRRKNATDFVKFAASANSALRLARALLRKSRPILVAVGGFGGSRKEFAVSHIAAGLAPVPGARIVGSAAARRTVMGLRPDERLTADSYDPDVADRVYAELANTANAILQAGHSVVVDASFFQPGHRRAIRAIAHAAGVPFTGLWLGGSRDTLPQPDHRDGEWPAIALDGGPRRVLAAARRLTGAALV